MYHVLICDKYRTLHSTIYKDEAMEKAKELQDKEETFAIVIMQDSRFVGDAIDGWYSNVEPHIRDAATLTGMYDRDF